MNRLLAAGLVAIALAVGLAIGVTAGGLVGSSSTPSPITALSSPSPTAAPTNEPSPSASPSPSSSPSPSASLEPSPTPEPTPVLVPAPLDGRLVAPNLAQRHVIAVMIDDLYAARPQSGLSRASIVWQAPAEGGIPRYMALFQEKTPAAVGPVRSARPYFVAWASEWNAVYVHAGGSPQANAILLSAKGKGKYVYNANALVLGTSYFKRISSRVAPHNLYTDGKQLRRLARRLGAKPIDRNPVWHFAPDADLSARPQGGKIVVPYPYNRIVYHYDRQTNTYLRSVSVEGKQVDAGTKLRIAPKNVVIMFMSFSLIHDGTNHGRLSAQLTGSGTAYIATNGKTIKGTWKKRTFKSPTRFYDRQGNPVTLTIGQTFVQVVYKGTNVTIQDGTVPAPAPSESPSAGPSPSGS